MGHTDSGCTNDCNQGRNCTCMAQKSPSIKGTTHTIKIDAAKSLVIQPNKTGPGVRFSFALFGADMATVVLTADQCAVLVNRVQIAQAQAGGAA